MGDREWEVLEGRGGSARLYHLRAAAVRDAGRHCLHLAAMAFFGHNAKFTSRRIEFRIT
jgi:hypothetical protein